MSAKKTKLEPKKGAVDLSYLLTYFVEQKNINDSFIKWPLHTTILPWFYVRDLNSLDKFLQGVASNHQTVKARVTEKTNFGELEVGLMEPIDNLKKIHKEIYHGLREQSANFISTRYFGENYTPHVTRQGDKSVDKDQDIIFDTFYLVRRERLPSGKYEKTVIKEYHFGQ